MVNITISNLLCYLEGSPLCHGINDQISNWSSSFVHHSVPYKHDYTAICSRPLDEKEYARSLSCLVILLPELEQDSPCNFYTKLFRAEQRSFRQKSKQLETPASLKAPISMTAPSRIKLTLQQERAKNNELQSKIADIKRELERNCKPVTKELDSDLVSIMSTVETSAMPPFMQLFWNE